MVKIPEKAVEAAIEAAGMEGWDHIEGRMRAALTAAAPHMSASAREQALEEAADECDKRGAVTSADAIRALKLQPAPQTGGGE